MALPYIIENRCLRVADVIIANVPSTFRASHQRFIKSIRLYRTRESCLHKTDVIEHVILVNGVVERNRNSGVYGSVVIIPRRDCVYPFARSGLRQYHEIGRDSGHFVSHASSTDAPLPRSSSTTPVGSIRYFSLFLPSYSFISFPIIFVFILSWPVICEICSSFSVHFALSYTNSRVTDCYLNTIHDMGCW